MDPFLTNKNKSKSEKKRADIRACIKVSACQTRKLIQKAPGVVVSSAAQAAATSARNTSAHRYEASLSPCLRRHVCESIHRGLGGLKCPIALHNGATKHDCEPRLRIMGVLHYGYRVEEEITSKTIVKSAQRSPSCRRWGSPAMDDVAG